MSFRDVAGNRSEWLNTGIEDHFSNFQFVDLFCGSSIVMRRIFSLARKLKYRSLLIDVIEEGDCKLLVEENAALRLRDSNYLSSKVYRFSFFRSRNDETPSAEDFIGYAVFKSDEYSFNEVISHVYESVIMPFRQEDQNNFIHCFRTYTVTCSIGTFSVRGVLYAQQNDRTFVCAQVALRTALASILPEGDVLYSKINQLARIDHSPERRVGEGHGFGPDEFKAVLEGLGIPFGTFAQKLPDVVYKGNFQHDLYGFIESGSPALIGFKLNDDPLLNHIVPVIGHTFNEDTWAANAQRNYFGPKHSYYPSENWLSTFVLHDDNFGPYYCMPRHFLKMESFSTMYGLKRYAYDSSAVDVEAVAITYFQTLVSKCPSRSEEWYDRLAVFQNHGQLVLRAIVCKKLEYIGHLRSIQCWNGTGFESSLIDCISRLLPEKFWLVEASARELFASSRRKFGEIIIVDQAKSPEKDVNIGLDLSLLLVARLPGVVYVKNNGDLVPQETQLKGHTDLFSFSKSAV